MTARMKILAISGSLRKVSSNTTLLRAAALLAPAGVEISLYGGLADLPPFNPDLDEEGSEAPPPVKDLRAQLIAADGVLISTPEYAHGVPGVLKNALDWVVSIGELAYKPVTLLNPSPRSLHAQASLMETLKTMSWKFVPDAPVVLPLSGKRLDEAGIAADPALAGVLRPAVAALVQDIEANRAGAGGLGSSLDFLPKG
jgi:chromate reductase, NAD(P)H dehydrogenase (quinone)